MFGLRKAGRTPLSDVKSADRWIDAHDALDPLSLQAEMLGELTRAVDGDEKLSLPRLGALFAFDARALRLVQTLCGQYVEHAGRSAKVEQQMWAALFDLEQAFLAAYQPYLREGMEHAREPRWAAVLPELVCRRIVHLGLDARIRLYRFESWIPARWIELNDLFAFSSSAKIDRRPVHLARDVVATTIEQQYLMVLLLQLLNTGNLSVRQVEWVYGELDDWSSSLRLTLEPAVATAFYVDLASREGLRRRTTEPLEGRVLFLDTRPLYAVLQQHLVLLEQKLKGKMLSEDLPATMEQANLISRLKSKVDPEFRPVRRRGERTAVEHRADAIMGLDRIVGYFREEDRDPNFEKYSSTSFGGTMELAVFGRIRQEDLKRDDLAKVRLHKYSAEGGPWDVKDVSQTGYRLVAPMSIASGMTLGALCAIRLHGQVGWVAGIVRRMRRLTSDRAELGLQIVANTLQGVDLVEPGKSAEFSLEGDEALANGRSYSALFLTLRQNPGDPGVHSLVVPAREYAPSRRLTLVTSKSVYRVVFGGPIEQTADWVWTAVEPHEVESSLKRVQDAAGGPPM